MRQEEFKMERTGLVEIGQVIPITEGKLPNSYYYTLGKAYAMSANYPVGNRIRSREGKVVDVKETEKEYFYINSFIHQIQLLQNIPFPFLLHLQLFPLWI